MIAVSFAYGVTAEWEKSGSGSASSEFGIEIARGGMLIGYGDSQMPISGSWTLQSFLFPRGRYYPMILDRQSMYGFDFAHDHGIGPGRFWVIVFPLWLPFGLFLLLAVVAVRWFFRDKNRARDGYCINCGYDLRATPGRCPECGTEAGTA